ncbi:hypothetical protein NG798_20095 [Ancylothrix sp. C2]|uniref:hypothetical protein n=1 Tax=Ancylothrix sp. D3o TaxID=2953691 RepID=UPI0021BA3BEF|nr:hypothetical protein [Ancylothrix sp. D3o]MCT7952103.1 hypothetical protein [Ancylothrix sp. D3o]
METIKLVFENPFFVLIVLGVLVTFLTWFQFQWGSYRFQMLSKTPASIKILITVIAAAIAVASMLALLVSVNHAPNIQEQTFYKKNNERFFALNLDKVGHSNFFPVISFYVFQRGQKDPEIYIGIMEFPSGSKDKAYSGKFKDYSVHGLCEGDVKVSPIGVDDKLKSFKLSFDPKIEKKSPFCQESEFQVTQHFTSTK